MAKAAVKNILTGLCIAGASLPAFAENYSIGSPTAFLDNASGARALGMGKAQAAIVEGPASLLWNPAGLAMPDRSRLSFNYVSLFEGGNITELGFAHSYDKPYGIGLDLTNFSIGDIITRDRANNVTGNTQDSRTGLVAGLGYQYSGKTYFGAAAKIINTSLAGESSSALGLDGGVLLDLGKYKIGLQLANIAASGLARAGGEDKLPRTIRLGTAFRPLPKLLCAADLVSATPGNNEVHLGAEYTPLSWVALRAGYDGNFLTAGAGVSAANLVFDYAVLKHEVFGLSHRLTLGYAFGPSAEEKMTARGQWKENYVAKAEHRKQKQQDKYAKARRIEQLLADAEREITGKNYEQAYTLSDMVANMDPGNATAQGIMDKVINSGFSGSIASGKPPQLEVERVAYKDPLGQNTLTALESGAITFVVKNAKGAGFARNVKAMVAVTPQTAIKVSNYISVGDIAPGRSDVVEIPISAGAELLDGSADFTISFREDGGNPPDPIKLEIATRELQPPIFEIASIDIDDKTSDDTLSVGNGDGALNKGESAEVTVTLLNKGSGDARGVSISLDGANVGQGPGSVQIYEGGNVRKGYRVGDIRPGNWQKVKFAVATQKIYSGPDDLGLSLKISEDRTIFNKSLPLGISLGKSSSKMQFVKVDPTLKATEAKVQMPTFGKELFNVPAYTTPARPDSFAVIVGIQKYRGANGVPFADRDADLMREYASSALGIPAENIKTLKNEYATKSDLENAFEVWLKNQLKARGGKNSEIFVFYSGHGAPSVEGDSYILPYDGLPESVEQTGYSLNRLYASLSNYDVKGRLVMLDSCFSGAGGPRTTIAKGTRPLGIVPRNEVGENTVAITAATGAQITGNFNEKEQGLLTYYLIRGLQGAADTNKDGKITVEETYAYLKSEVIKQARLDNREQDPQLISSGSLGVWAEEPLAVLK